jgi:hypothetical protein
LVERNGKYQLEVVFLQMAVLKNGVKGGEIKHRRKEGRWKGGNKIK